MDKIKRLASGEGGKETEKEQASAMHKSDSVCAKCGGKHKTMAHGAKGEAMKKAKRSDIGVPKSKWGPKTGNWMKILPGDK